MEPGVTIGIAAAFRYFAERRADLPSDVQPPGQRSQLYYTGDDAGVVIGDDSETDLDT